MTRRAMPRRARLLAATFACTALALAACGTTDGDEDAKATTTTKAESTTSTTKAETTTTAAPEDDAQARAEAIDFEASVLGAGWTASPHEEDSANDSPITKCNPEAGDKTDEVATFNTDDFETGDVGNNDGAQLNVETKVFIDEDAAKKQVAVFSDDEIINCVSDAFKEVFTGATVTGDLTESALTTSADETKALSGTYTVASPDGSQSIDVGLVFVVLRTGDLASAITGVAVGTEANKEPVALQAAVDEVAKLQAAG